MAYAVEVTISTGNKISLNYQSQEVNVSLTYRLEREDTDVLAVVEDKADELVRAHALAWKRVKEGERPEPAKEEEYPVLEEPPAQKDGATQAQVRLICSLGRQAGLDEDELKTKIRRFAGYDDPESLSYDQAASLIVELGREERERFEQERVKPLPQSEYPNEKTTFSPHPDG